MVSLLYSNQYEIRKVNKSARIFYSLPVLVALIGCAKESTTKVEASSNSSSQTTIASDEITINNEFDQAADEAIAVVCNLKTSIAGAIVDTSQISSGIIEIDYYGKEAGKTKSRTGADSIHQNLVAGHIVPWGTPGATFTMTFGTVNSPGYEVLFTSNNTSIRLGGTVAVTNIYGGYLQNVTAADSLVEKLRGSLEYTFDDNAATIHYNPFNVNQVRVFTKPDTILYAATRADTDMSNFQNVSNWGVNRFGNMYYTILTKTVTQNISNYNLSYNPLNGTKIIENISEPITCNLGVNQQGNIINSGTPYGFVITWINGGGQNQSVIGYYY